MFLEQPKQKPSYVESSYRGWTVRTSSDHKSIIFKDSRVFKYDNLTHLEAMEKAEKINAELNPRSATSSMFKTSCVVNFNQVFLQSVCARIGELTGVEFFMDGEQTTLRLLRKNAFREIKHKQVRSGGCCNLTAKDIVNGNPRAVRVTVPKSLGISCKLELATRYELVYSGEDPRGLLFSVRKHSIVDRDDATLAHTSLNRPCFTTYGDKTHWGN